MKRTDPGIYQEITAFSDRTDLAYHLIFGASKEGAEVGRVATQATDDEAIFVMQQLLHLTRDSDVAFIRVRHDNFSKPSENFFIIIYRKILYNIEN